MLPSRTALDIVNIHASCVAAGNGGVLILGQSGQGKSDLALRLIDRGARLVADDRCDVWHERGRLWCRPPGPLAGKIEVRGIGIVEQPWTAPVPLALAVRLTDRYDRMPTANQVETVAGHPLPALLLSAFEASAPIKILLALERLAPAA
ncbi:HPr kinase/phosphorylase [Sphingopyxis panaciterrulae]|jgi:serine kinase of HPr protein (carbohydrate metabolism regulator)|uniref:Serine kinase of HPr protein (Carbohydrate metabolism regulator) n=1 Tax=Sphingopyxis panaciterrulae TaxID=462372 RepID=A0A7W9B3W4_9SPHN|nr:HPr kinase/phosphatase C-terminal domain-containing protein [Sphingopyxis panaciterrulae]MBB5705767.1 serine kinase of HPr protein (carbohydrate metabolism regulator) [Sphingopyxis panaciterrulae]